MPFFAVFGDEKHSRVFRKFVMSLNRSSVYESDTEAAWPCAGQKSTLVIKVVQSWGSDHPDPLWQWVGIHWHTRGQKRQH